MARTEVPVTDITPVKATLTTACSGTHDDLVFTAAAAGPDGNNIRVRYVVSGTGTALSVVVEGKDVTVNVATDGSAAATSTAAQVKTALEANTDAAALISVALNSGNDGTGVVDAFSFTALAGGSWAQTPPSVTNGDSTNDHYFTGNDGFVFLEVISTDGSDQTVTLHYSPALAPGVTAAAYAETIPAGATRLLGPFSPSKFNQNAAKDVYFDPAVSGTLDFRAYRVTRAT